MRGLLSDGGGIYTLGTSTGTVLRNNVLHDIFPYESPTIAWGVYLDAETNQITVENNLCYNIQNGGLMFHNGAFENTIRNNIFTRCADQTVWRSSPSVTKPNLFERNICCVTQGALFLYDAQPDAVSKWDYNLYWRTDGAELLFMMDPLEEWQALGLDQHSIIADPEFLDPDHADFRLKPTSPAITKLGFKPFDASQAGLYGDPKWVAQPKRVKFAPTVLPPPPPGQVAREIADDFEATGLGDPPKDAVVSLGGPMATIQVADDVAASGRHSLKFTDAAGLDQVWNPHMFYQPHLTKGVARARFKLWIGAGALPWIEWRDANAPYKVGPSFQFDAAGQLHAGGPVLLTVPHEQWIGIEIACPLGKEANGHYDLTVTVPGQEPRKFAQLACDPNFKRLEWFGFVSLADAKTVFYVDDLHLKAGKD
jgi:hypothetical protein